MVIWIVLASHSSIITQDSPTNFTIGTDVELKTFWNEGQAYWYELSGSTVSYWTFPQVQSYRTSGDGAWQYKVPSALENSTIIGNKLSQNYTLASGSRRYSYYY